MSEKKQEAKTKESNEDVMKKFIKKHMGRPYEKIASDKRIAIAKRIQKEFEEEGELDDLHFKAAVTAGLVEKEPEP